MVAWWLVAAGVAAASVALVVPLRYLRARRRGLEGVQASARAAVERLAHYVETVHPGDDPVAARLLTDATERWHTAGALIAQAGTAGEYKVARATAREGLRLVDQACQRLGIPGPAHTTGAT